jgi:nucleotide-binding universal stress UspA family protein
MSIQPVIAAVDGSDDSLRALEWAVEAAQLREAPLRVIHVRQYAAWAPAEVLAADTGHDPVLDDVRAWMERRGETPETKYTGLVGLPSAVLPQQSATAQLLVLGSRGRGGFKSLLLGSSGLAAARDAECPVVVVPRPGREAAAEAPIAAGPRVVVGLNVDSPDEVTLAFAFAEAALRGAALQVVAAYPWPVQTWATPVEFVQPVVDEEAIVAETRTLAEGFLTTHRDRHPDVTVDLRTAAGDAAGALVTASSGADLIVVGRHRRRLRAPARMMGSVTQAVLLHAAAPIAVIPPTPAVE